MKLEWLYASENRWIAQPSARGEYRLAIDCLCEPYTRTNIYIVEAQWLTGAVIAIGRSSTLEGARRSAEAWHNAYEAKLNVAASKKNP